MRKLLIAACIASAAALGGCAGFPSSGTIAADVAAVEAQIQADTNLACGFIPTIATIAALIPGAGTAVADAATVAAAICSAVAKAPPVTTASAKLRSMTANVNVNVATVNVPGIGPVPIAGKFTR